MAVKHKFKLVVITTLLGSLMYSMGVAKRKTKKDVNITKSFAVVIVLVIAIIVLGIIAVFWNPPESPSSTDPDPKTESVGSRCIH